MNILYVLACILGICYIIFIVSNLKNLAIRIRDQFSNAELNWEFIYEWLFAGFIHSITEIIVFLILAMPATIHFIIALPSIFREAYEASKNQRLQARK